MRKCRWLTNCIVVGLCILITSCAYNEYGYTECSASSCADKSSGIRYYNPANFLLVYSDGNDGHVVELLTLPDTTALMAVDPVAIFASNETTLEFKNGMLASAVESVDSTSVPKAVLSAAKDIAIANAKAFREAEDSTVITVPTPYLFKIVREDGAWQLVGGQAAATKTMKIKASNPGE